MKCPLCGSAGDDLLFAFYCGNPECSNYAPQASIPLGTTTRFKLGDVILYGKIGELRKVYEITDIDKEWNVYVLLRQGDLPITADIKDVDATGDKLWSGGIDGIDGNKA